jgi:ketosteroid isomerase-like protein
MYKFFVKRKVRKALAALSAGDADGIVQQFRPQSRFMFAGEHALGVDLRGPEAVRRWFGEMHRRFPGIQIVPVDVVVNGWPWNTTVATHLVITAPRAGGRTYRNEGMQLLRLSWGRIVEDLIFEDTQRIADELRRTEHSDPAHPVATTR